MSLVLVGWLVGYPLLLCCHLLWVLEIGKFRDGLEVNPKKKWFKLVYDIIREINEFNSN